MTIKVGDRIPNATLNYLKDGVQAINTDEIFKGKKVVLFLGARRFHTNLFGQASSWICGKIRRISKRKAWMSPAWQSMTHLS